MVDLYNRKTQKIAFISLLSLFSVLITVTLLLYQSRDSEIIVEESTESILGAETETIYKEIEIDKDKEGEEEEINDEEEKSDKVAGLVEESNRLLSEIHNNSENDAPDNLEELSIEEESDKSKEEDTSEEIEEEYIDPKCRDSMLVFYTEELDKNYILCEEYKNVTLPAVDKCESNISEYMDDCKRLYGCYPTRMGIYCPGGEDYVACAYDKVSQCKDEYKDDLTYGYASCLTAQQHYNSLEYCHNLGYF